MTTDDGLRLVFHIDAYTPATMPMAKLGEYLTEFAKLLGTRHQVRFEELRAGSTQIVSRVAFEDVPKVTGRLLDLGHDRAPDEARKLYLALDKQLANDNATGRIASLDSAGSIGPTLLAFPGRSRTRSAVFGPFTQAGHLDGILVSIGGKDETISVRLQNEATIYTNCETSRALARDLARHLFEPVRIHGQGRWLRDAAGAWVLVHFRVQSFAPLQAGTLREAVQALREIGSTGWRAFPDALAEWQDIRGETDGLH